MEIEITELVKGILLYPSILADAMFQALRLEYGTRDFILFTATLLALGAHTGNVAFGDEEAGPGRVFFNLGSITLVILLILASSGALGRIPYTIYAVMFYAWPAGVLWGYLARFAIMGDDEEPAMTSEDYNEMTGAVPGVIAGILSAVVLAVWIHWLAIVAVPYAIFLMLYLRGLRKKWIEGAP